MANPQKAVAYIEMEDYLALENASAYKHEYLDGVIYAIQGAAVRGMAGASAAHADVISNAGFALHGKLKGTPCRVKTSDMRLRIDAVGAVFYPDVLVHCEPVGDPVTTTELTAARLAGSWGQVLIFASKRQDLTPNSLTPIEESQGENWTGENPPSGIAGGLAET